MSGQAVWLNITDKCIELDTGFEVFRLCKKMKSFVSNQGLLILSVHVYVF